MGPRVNDYRDLEVWQRARTIAKAVYQLTRAFPPDELYGMTSQIRRAATSIAADIAEGWGRHYSAEFVRSLRLANGSRAELETHLVISADIGLCPESAVQSLLQDLAILGKQLLSLERSLERKQR